MNIEIKGKFINCLARFKEYKARELAKGKKVNCIFFLEYDFFTIKHTLESGEKETLLKLSLSESFACQNGVIGKYDNYFAEFINNCYKKSGKLRKRMLGGQTELKKLDKERGIGIDIKYYVKPPYSEEYCKEKHILKSFSSEAKLNTFLNDLFHICKNFKKYARADYVIYHRIEKFYLSIKRYHNKIEFISSCLNDTRLEDLPLKQINRDYYPDSLLNVNDLQDLNDFFKVSLTDFYVRERAKKISKKDFL